MAKILIDTCALIWLLLEEVSKLGNEALSIIEDESIEKLVSPISFLEIATKSNTPKFILKGEDILTKDRFRPVILDTMELFNLRSIGLELDHTLHLYSLAYFSDHKDPSDRIIVAQAIIENAAIVSSDGKLYYYGFSEQYRNVWTQPAYGI